MKFEKLENAIERLIDDVADEEISEMRFSIYADDTLNNKEKFYLKFLHKCWIATGNQYNDVFSEYTTFASTELKDIITDIKNYYDSVYDIDNVNFILLVK